MMEAGCRREYKTELVSKSVEVGVAEIVSYLPVSFLLL
jgi:hypothetical protein